MDDGVQLSDGTTIPVSELDFRFVRSGGPGGQNVNKVATKVELLFVPATSSAFSEPRRSRLLARLAGRLDRRGVLRVTSQRFRKQGENRRACMERLAGILDEALVVRKRRIPTRPTRGSQERRLAEKRRRSRRKHSRGKGGIEDGG